MKWKIIEDQGSFMVCRKTWHSSEWMGIDKKDIRLLLIRGRSQAFEVFAETATLELAEKVLRFKERDLLKV